ncbi:MAG TPA: amino acid adenylation domain-containing protein, partial [Vicinamibacteria bacterium]
MSEGNAAGSALAAKKRALLAQMMKERGLQGSSAQTVPRRGDGSGRPLSFAQQRLWFLDQLEPDSPRYNVFSAYRLQGRVDAAALGRSLTELTRRHELLRARFEPRDGQPHQQLRALEPFPLLVEDLRARPAAERETEARRLALAEARRPFDLARGPLLRGTLLTLEDAEHALLLTMHHIVADGWSVGVLGRELWTLYEAFRRGAASPLPEPELQYADFAAWQRATLQGEWLERQLAYWRGRLAGVATLELPTDRPRPAVPGFEGAWQARPLAPGLLDGLKAAGQASGATLYMTLLAGFAAWLSRWSGQADVAVGSPIANRTRAELEGLVGLFANTLVMRVDLSGDPSFRELLARVREVALGAYAHQDVPFERLVEELNPERQLSRSPLFQAALVLDAGSGATAPLRLGELAVSPGGLDNRVSKFDLTLTVVDAEPALLALEYSTELFEPATVARMLEQLERLLAAGLQAPDRPLSALPLLTPGEEHALQAWNQTARDYPVRCVHALFEEQVERTPDAVALAFESATLTYRELDQRANRLAHRLRALGVGPEARVGICMERSLEMVVSLLAVLKAGGAYVPLDPGYPEDRLGFMLADSGVSVLLTQARLAPRLPGHAAAVVAVDAEADALARLPAINRDGGARPDNLAYVIYTSGSTGRPKGAMNQHGAVCNRLLWMQEQYRLGPDDRVLQKTPFSFDVSVWEFFWPLMVGARLVIARPEGHRDAAYLARLMADERITTVHFVPSMLRQFLEEPSAAEAAALRRVICSGEALPHDLQERFFSLMAAELHNLYGPTEAAVDVTCWPCRRGDERHVVPIGRPIANTQAHVLDARLRPVPLGAVGELFLGGVQVGRGYLGRPDLTAERFVPDPCGDRPGARLYRTGDLARWLPDGSVEYLGRVDFQVKVRGFRIELGEVEAALLAHPAVMDAVVVAREDRPGDQRLVAYLVGPAPAGELRRHLLGRLPEYMVPSAFVTLPALPLSPNGKVDRRALPAPGDGGLAPRGGVLRTPSEEALAAIWEGVLRRAPVGPDDNFFELGGHSLLATQVIAQVRKTLGAELPLRAMFEAPTVRALAARVDAARREEPALPAIEPVPRDGPLPLSFAQERLFFLDGLGAGSVYHVPLALRLRGPLDEAALRASLAALVRRHEALRTRVVAEGGRARQVVDDAAGVDLAREDLTGAAGEEREAALRSRVADEVARPFDLARAPLMRARLLRLGEDDHALVLTFHHVVSDAWSLGIVLRELAELYRAHRRGEAAALPPLPVQYADYAAWQRRWLTDAALAEHVDYWRRTLSGVSVLDLPTDRPRTGDPGFAGGCEAVAWPPELLASVRELGRREGATLFMALLAAFQAVLQRWAGQDDVAVGTPIAGRTRSETDGVVGLFVNTLVMRTGLGGDPTFRELLARVRTVALEAYDHQDLPFERLVEELRPERDLDLNPLFQVMFALQNAGTGRVALDDLAVSPADLAVRTTHFDLELHAHEQEGGGLLAAVTYRRDLFDAGTVRRLLGHLGTLLAAAAADPGRRLSALPLLAEAEERQRARWNQTAAVVPPDRTVVDLFAAEAGRAPQALAVAAGGATVTYGELEARANRLARRLRAIGVGREVVVAICAERSIEMVLGALAVVKAGGAYLPLDPSYPAERLAYMLEDSRAPVVLAQEQVRATLPPTTARVLVLDAEAAAFTHEDPGPLGHAPAADDLAYVIYTSGSTGRPKGVALAHHGLLNLALWHAEAYAVAAADRATQVASPAFDASVWEIWPYLIRGASLHVPSEETRLSAPRLLSWLRDEGITHTFLPTPLAEAVLKEPDVADLPLRWLLTGGDKLHRVPARALPFRLVNHYGPTESTVVATCAEVAPGEPLDPPIGLPIANTCAHVLDARLRPVPAGVRGELYVGGIGLARGYLGRPDLTAERFVPDPLSAEPGARLYRTGDVVRRLADGRLEFLGRADDQVKLRGYRIELGEIESVLGAHPAVGGAAAVVREDDGTRRLVAYVTPRDGQPVPLEHLRSHLRERLPAYMVPSALVVLPALPVSPNGKVDRRALPAPAEPGAGRDSYEAPRTPAETVLARVWAEVLRVDPVGIRDNFFELGGDSILSLQVVARAGEAGLRLSLKQVFQHQTIAELAEVAGTAAEMDAEQGPVAGEAPLTPIQRWYLSPGREAPAHFNQAVLLELRRPVPADVLARAVAAVEAHHDALRMRFAPGASGWTQRLSEPGGEAPFAQVDLSSVAPEERPAATLAACERAQRSLDLERGPLGRRDRREVHLRERRLAPRLGQPLRPARGARLETHAERVVVRLDRGHRPREHVRGHRP